MTKIIMRTEAPKNITQIIKFLELNKTNNIQLDLIDDNQRYFWIDKTIKNLKYKRQKKHIKVIIQKYLILMTNYSKPHLKRLIRKAVKGKLKYIKRKPNRKSFTRKYNNQDILLLAQMDKFMEHPNGISLKKNLEDMFNIFKKEEYSNIKNISPAHIYRLINKHNFYREKSERFSGTKPVKNTLVKRIKPEPLGQPGYIRVDTVHSGEIDGVSGGYFINFCDEVLQWEILLFVETISERHLLPILEIAIDLFPYKIINFHSDNGSEFINKLTVQLLTKLQINQSKSRPRRHNDNALIETKNGSVVRTHFGYYFVEGKYAPQVNQFLIHYFNKYLNFYRASLYPTEHITDKGKVIKKYKNASTPFAKIKELFPEGNYLKENITYDILQKQNQELDTISFMTILREEKRNLYRYIGVQKQVENMMFIN